MMNMKKSEESIPCEKELKIETERVASGFQISDHIMYVQAIVHTYALVLSRPKLLELVPRCKCNVM
jgi:hypothetical protein